MVLAIGGPVIDLRDTRPSGRGLSSRVETTARTLTPLVRNHQVVVTHVVGSDRSFGAALAGALRDAVPGLVTTSLKPRTLVDVAALVDAGLTVITSVASELSAVALANAIEADALMLIAEVDAVYRDFGTPRATPLRRLTTTEAKVLLDRGAVTPPGLTPKLDAALRFAATGGFAVIAAIGDVEAALHRAAGTRVVLTGGGSHVPQDPRQRRSCGAQAYPSARGAAGSPVDGVVAGSVSPKSRRNGGYSSRISPA